MTKIVVCALYQFVALEDFQALQDPILTLLKNNNVKGTILLASEGINGTIAGTRVNIDKVIEGLKSDSRLQNLEHKESFDEQMPFYRSKVKLKKEIVTMGVEGLDPNRTVGTHIRAEHWNALISDPEVTLIDTRNGYEIEIGTFKNAINPDTNSFREFPEYVKNNLDPQKHKKIAMFCTGGIRCEKATAYLKENGFAEVFHLEGGILKYLENIPKEESLWDGECFVFDNRVAVNHALGKGSYDQCHACRRPITEEDKQRPEFERGVSCAKCYEMKTDGQKKGFKERQKQIDIALEKGEVHLGSEVADRIQQRKIEKCLAKERQKQLFS